MTEAHFQEVSMTDEEAAAISNVALSEIHEIVEVAAARIFAARGSIYLGDHAEGRLSRVQFLMMELGYHE
tara:strand:+ start:105 stop:314 length:210 start_codon:yes stop_codon:yes gene_type:complete